MFLPRTPNPIPHVVKSHTSPSLTVHHETEQQVTKPFASRTLLHLYEGSTTDIMFQQYAKAFKSSQSQEFLSKLKTDRFTDLFFEDNHDRWRIDVSAQDNYTTWLLRHYNIDSTNRKSVPYLAINLITAKQMGWVVETASNVFELGQNLLMELPEGITGVKR